MNSAIGRGRARAGHGGTLSCARARRTIAEHAPRFEDQRTEKFIEREPCARGISRGVGTPTGALRPLRGDPPGAHQRERHGAGRGETMPDQLAQTVPLPFGATFVRFTVRLSRPLS